MNQKNISANGSLKFGFLLAVLAFSIFAKAFPVFAATAGTGSGLEGYYFNSMDFSAYKTDRLDSQINFNWGLGSPITGVTTDHFSVRWLGKIQPQYSEVYTFYTVSDDGVRLWVNDQLIIDQWYDQGGLTHAGSVRLNAGQLYDIKLEYYDNTLGASVSLSWVSPSQAKQIVPTSQLYPPGTVTPPPADLFGVNISGAEFGVKNPGTLNTDYLYAATNYNYFAARNQTLIRIPFKWERVQHQALGSLSAPDVWGLEAILNTAEANGQKVILDMHNFARYYGVALTKAQANNLDDVWIKLATSLKNYPALYGYELMNEPHDLPEGSDGWAYLAQSATTAIRKVDTTHYVLVPGYSWQSSLNWPTANPTLNVIDPANKLLYAAHDYFDHDQSGTYAWSYDAEGVTAMTGVDRLQPFIAWLKGKNAKGIITEYGVPGNDGRYLTTLDNFLSTIKNEPTLVGGTYWSAGPWWGNYSLSVEPNNGVDKPQMLILKKY